MCNYSDFIYEKGVSDGELKGKAEGKAEDLIQLMKNLKLTFEQALTALSVPEIEWDGRATAFKNVLDFGKRL